MRAARFIATVRAVLYCLRRPHYRPVRTRDALGRVVAIGATRSSVPTVVFWRAPGSWVSRIPTKRGRA